MSEAQFVTLTEVIIKNDSGAETSLNILTDLLLADNAKQTLHHTGNISESGATP